MNPPKPQAILYKKRLATQSVFVVIYTVPSPGLRKHPRELSVRTSKFLSLPSPLLKHDAAGTAPSPCCWCPASQEHGQNKKPQQLLIVSQYSAFLTYYPRATGSTTPCTPSCEGITAAIHLLCDQITLWLEFVFIQCISCQQTIYAGCAALWLLVCGFSCQKWTSQSPWWVRQVNGDIM